MIRDFPLLSRNIFHAYADSSMPDDSGDGRSWATAKKTLDGLITVLPEMAINHVVIHLKGTFDLVNYLVFGVSTFSGLNLNIIVDGGDDVDILDGPYTATGGTTLSVIDTARSWTPNQYQGYSVEILDGALAGYMQTIDTNTATELLISVPWPSSPGTAQYRITRPATVITSSSNKWLLYGGHHTYMLWFQRLRLTGSASIGALTGAKLNVMWFGDTIFEGTSRISPNASTNLSWYKYDPINVSGYMESTKVKKAVGLLSSYATPYSPRGNTHFIYGPNVINGLMDFEDCVLNFGSGRYKKIKCTNTIVKNYSPASNSKRIISGSDAIGLEAINSSITLSSIVTSVDSNSTHGIELKSSIMSVSGIVISGSGNGGVGIYAHANSHVQLEKANMPTVTGTVGDAAVNDPTDPETWADIEAADGLISAQEGTRIDLV